MDSIISELSALSVLEMVASISAFAYVWLAARQSIWCWPCALLSSGIYTWVFWETALPHQSWLNLYYVLMAIYGWLAWNRMSKQESVVSVKHLAWKWHIIALIALAALTQLLVMLTTAEQAPTTTHYLDAGVAVFSVFTTFLVTQKVVENWVYWIVINSVATYLYATQGLYFTTLLFIGYCIMSVYGLKAWLNSSKAPVASTAS